MLGIGYTGAGLCSVVNGVDCIWTPLAGSGNNSGHGIEEHLIG